MKNVSLRLASLFLPSDAVRRQTVNRVGRVRTKISVDFLKMDHMDHMATSIRGN